MKHPFKKSITGIVIFLFLTVFNFAFAQIKYRYSTTRQERLSYRDEFSARITLFFGAGVLSARNHAGNLNIRFPYQTMDMNGIKTWHVFNGKSDRLLSKQSPELTFGLDISKPFYALNFSSGFNTTYQGAYYSIGYGRNIFRAKKIYVKRSGI